MTGLFTFASKSGRERSLLALYVLHSLDISEKSGYDILKEIETLTNKAWIPSKGTLYPLLNQLREEGLIEPGPSHDEIRARIGFVLTKSGRDTLKKIRAHSRDHHTKMAQYRHLITAIFGDVHSPVLKTVFEIKAILDDLPKEKEQDAAGILRRCRDELRTLSAQEPEP